MLFYDPYWEEPVLYDLAASFDAFVEAPYQDEKSD